MQELTHTLFERAKFIDHIQFNSQDIKLFFDHTAITTGYLNYLSYSKDVKHFNKENHSIDDGYSPDFLKVLEKFKNKPWLLLTTYCAKLVDLANETGEISLLNIKLNKANFDNLKLIVDNEPLFEITVDLTDFNVSELKKLISQLNAIKTVYHLTCIGTYAYSFYDFAQELTQFVTISAESISPNPPDLQSDLEQIVYRNLWRDYLQDRIDRDMDINSALMKAWWAMPSLRVPLDRVIPYHKLLEDGEFLDAFRLFLLKPFSKGKISTTFDNKQTSNQMSGAEEEKFFIPIKNDICPVEDCFMTNFCVRGMGVSFFRLFIKSLENRHLGRTVYLNYSLSDREWSFLYQSILKNQLSVDEWEIFIDEKTLENKDFLAFLAALNYIPAAHLILVIKDGDLGIAKALLEKIQQINPCYLIQLASISQSQLDLDKHQLIPEVISLAEEQSEFKQIISKIYHEIIKNFRIRNWDKFNGRYFLPAFSFPNTPWRNEEKEEHENLFAEEITLKKIIHLSRSGNFWIQKRHDFERFVNVEYQHTINAEQLVQQQQVRIQMQQTHVTAELYPDFSGNKVSFNDLLLPPYRDLYDINCLLHFKKEWFSTLPYGIQYFSHTAALYIAENLRSLISVNFSHLKAMGFCLKKQAGDMVLDYDPCQQKTFLNEFTPS